MENKLITAPDVRAMCGRVSDMTLWRWIHDPNVNFPKPIYIGKRRYFRQADVAAWIEAQAGANAA